MSPHAEICVAVVEESIVYGDGYLPNTMSIASGSSIDSGIILDKTPSAISSDGTLASHASSDEDSLQLEFNMPPAPSQGSFLAFRLNYLLVTLVIMLADGLQGTKLQGLINQVVFGSLFCLRFPIYYCYKGPIYTFSMKGTVTQLLHYIAWVS
jgi:hypothetical protein